MKAIVCTPVADLRKVPLWLKSGDFSHNDNRLTQLLYNEPLIIHKKKGPWIFVEALEQRSLSTHNKETGYFGYLHQSEVLRVSTFELPNLVICSNTHPYSYGTAFVGKKIDGGYTLLLQKKQTLFVPQNHARPLEATTDKIFIQEAKQFIGTPYLWGGRSSSGLDCSGLVHLLYRAQGILLPRDAHDQYVRKKAPKALYLYPIKKSKRVTHVILQLTSNTYIEAPETGKTVRLLRKGQELILKKEGVRLEGRSSLYGYEAVSARWGGKAPDDLF